MKLARNTSLSECMEKICYLLTYNYILYFVHKKNDNNRFSINVFLSLNISRNYSWDILYWKQYKVSVFYKISIQQLEKKNK